MIIIVKVMNSLKTSLCSHMRPRFSAGEFCFSMKRRLCTAGVLSTRDDEAVVCVPIVKPGGIKIGNTMRATTTLNAMSQEISLRDIDGEERKLLYLDTTSGPSPISVPSEVGANRPLVILCGTAQSIPTWSLHLRQLAKTRRVLIPELRSQGRSTQLLIEHCTLDQHTKDLHQFLAHVVKCGQQVDLVGFSLGGRIGLSFAESYPEIVRSISVTGVPHQRPYLGQLILRSWLKGLEDAEYEKTSWSFFENGVTAKFLERNQRSMARMVADVMKGNCERRLRNLLEKALASGALGMSGIDPDSSVSVSRGRLRLSCRAQVIASDEDRLAGSGSEQRLAEVIDAYHTVPGIQCRFDKIANCGHLAPFERPAEWRKLVMDFMGDSTASEADTSDAEESS